MLSLCLPCADPEGAWHEQTIVLWLNLSLVVLLLCAGIAQAVSITHTWNFHSTCYTHGRCNKTSKPVGNVRTAPSDHELDVKVSAYAFTTPSGTGPASDAWLDQYVNTNGGLGTTNASGDSHTVDNVGNADFVVFEFSAPVHVTSYNLKIFADADTTWYVGNLAAGFDFTGKTLADVNALELTMGNNTWSARAIRVRSKPLRAVLLATISSWRPV